MMFSLSTLLLQQTKEWPNTSSWVILLQEWTMEQERKRILEITVKDLNNFLNKVKQQQMTKPVQSNLETTVVKPFLK